MPESNLTTKTIRLTKRIDSRAKTMKTTRTRAKTMNAMRRSDQMVLATRPFLRISPRKEGLPGSGYCPIRGDKGIMYLLHNITLLKLA